MARTRIAWGIAGAAALAAAAIAWGVGAAGAQPHVAARSVGACANGQLVNWLNTAPNGAAGTVYYQLQFTNVSAHECSLYGYPGVSAVDAAGHRIGDAARRNGPRTPAVDVKPGGTVRASLGIVDTGNFPASSCRPVTADGLRVYAPNQTSSDVIPFPFSTCSRATDDSLTIGSVAH